MLKNTSQIKISGGCEVFAEASITFSPSGKDTAMVRLDNSGRWFYDKNSNPIPSFEIKVYTRQLSVFLKRWVELIQSIQKKVDNFSTREATVTIDFSFDDKDLHHEFSENKGGYHLDLLIESLESFVDTCHKKAAPAISATSNPIFSPKNKTEAFLAAPDQREKVVIQFNDMNGLHGGRIVVVTGTGNAMVLTVSHHNEQKKLWEQRYIFDISRDQLDKIYKEMIDIDVITIQLEDRIGVPDETRIHLTITNAGNESFKLETWEKSNLPPSAGPSNPRARFDKACLPLKRLEHIAKTEKKPVQEGPYVSP